MSKCLITVINTIPGARFILSLLLLALAACTGQDVIGKLDQQEKRAVYVLVDASNYDNKEFGDVQKVLRYLLKTLQPGESLALARIDSGNFSEEDIVARMTFDIRPSLSNAQKRAFLQMLDNFSKQARMSKETDITGGVLQAIEYLNDAGTRSKHILLFSDLKEEEREDHVRDFRVNFSGANVVAMYTDKSKNKETISKAYAKRLVHWQSRVEQGMGNWKQISDLEQLDAIFK